MDSPNNKLLNGIIPIIYGAVFSFAFYVLSQIILEIYNNLPNYFIVENRTEFFIGFRMFIKKLILFIIVIIYMMEDVGAVLKLQEKYPYVRKSRYFHEIFISSLYVSTFTFILNAVFLAVFCVSLIIVWSGIWCNQLKEEYFNISGAGQSFVDYMRDLRDMHYIGGSFIFIEVSFSIVVFGTMSLEFYPLITVLTTFVLWRFVTLLYMVNKHKSNIKDFSVFVLLPRRIYSKLLIKTYN
jgi:hypothetical protein